MLNSRGQYPYVYAVNSAIEKLAPYPCCGGVYTSVEVYVENKVRYSTNRVQNLIYSLSVTSNWKA